MVLMFGEDIENDDDHGDLQGSEVLYAYAYGSVSAGRGKWLFHVLFFLKVEAPCDQT